MGNPPLLIVLWFTLTCWPFFHQLLHIQGEFKKYELLKKIKLIVMILIICTNVQIVPTKAMSLKRCSFMIVIR